MAKYAVLIHGKGGSPNTSWLPWLRKELEGCGYGCKVPTFPPQDDSKLNDWYKELNRQSIIFAQTTFIAHARGAMALLRWVNTLPSEIRIHQIITVSCNFDYQPGRTDGDEFYTEPLDYDDLRRKCHNFVVIHSADDPYVPVAAGEQLAAHLKGRLVRYETAGHFGSDKLEAPEILEELVGWYPLAVWFA